MEEENSHPNSFFTILIRNVSSRTSSQSLRDVFGRYGEIRNIYMPVDYNTKKPRGFAFVEYYDKESMLCALDGCNGYNLDGREINCIIAHNSKKSPETMRQRERARVVSHRGMNGSYRRDRDRDRDRGYGRNRSRSRSYSNDSAGSYKGRSYRRGRSRSSSRDMRTPPRYKDKRRGSDSLERSPSREPSVNSNDSEARHRRKRVQSDSRRERPDVKSKRSSRYTRPEEGRKHSPRRSLS